MFRILGRAVRAAIRFAINGQYRAVACLRVLKRSQLHQTTAYTALDRYPHIFSRCQDLLGASSALNILSFGCSTGEEVMTLRRYFPDAALVGADINPHSLAVARAAPHDQRISFIKSKREEIRKRGPYDAIFCMAVFQRTPQVVEEQGLEDISRIYPFERFETEIEFLQRQIKPGGLLIVEHAAYRVQDTCVADRLLAVPVAAFGRATLTFDRSGRRLPGRAHWPVILANVAVDQAGAEPVIDRPSS